MRVCICVCELGSSFTIVVPQNFTIIQDKLFAYANAKQYTNTTNNTFHTNEQITNNNSRHSVSSRAHCIYRYVCVFVWTSKWWHSISKCYRNLLLLLHPLSLSQSHCIIRLVSLFRFVPHPSTNYPFFHSHTRVYYMWINYTVSILQYAKTRTDLFSFWFFYLFLLLYFRNLAFFPLVNVHCTYS